MTFVASVADVALPPTRTHSGELNVSRPAGLRWQPSASGCLTGSGPASAAAGLAARRATATISARTLRPSSVHSRERVLERVEHHVRARLFQLLAGVVAGRDP